MLRDNYDFLSEFLVDIGNIKFSNEICCDEVRETILKEALGIIFDEIGFPIEEDCNSNDMFSYLRKGIINDSSLNSTEKIELIKKMYSII
jgi:hypothetical protein